MFKFVLIAAALIFVTGCGKTAEEKAADHADAVQHRQAALVDYLNATVPNGAMTDAQLDEYEKNLNEFEALEAEFHRIDGKDGVRVAFADSNPKFIAQRRLLLAIARAEKSSGHSTLTSKQAAAQVSRLEDEYDQLEVKMTAALAAEKASPTKTHSREVYDLAQKEITNIDSLNELLAKPMFSGNQSATDRMNKMSLRKSQLLAMSKTRKALLASN